MKVKERKITLTVSFEGSEINILDKMIRVCIDGDNIKNFGDDEIKFMAHLGENL